MATVRVARFSSLHRQAHVHHIAFLETFAFRPVDRFATSCSRQLSQRRCLHQSQCFRREQRRQDNEKFGTRLGKAWRSTRVEWRPIPIGLGIAFLGVWQFFRMRHREAIKKGESDAEAKRRPPRRERIYPTGGGWQVQIMSTLPLKAISRLWGRFNEVTIPYYLRVPGFKLYGWIFGVNFAEVGKDDLHEYPNLASFFYRELKPGLRPLDPNPRAVLSPADGTVLQFGKIQHGEVEQVKGMTYKLDALLGNVNPSDSPHQTLLNSTTSQNDQSGPSDDPEARSVRADEEFANMNGISYTLSSILSGTGRSNPSQTQSQSEPGQQNNPPASTDQSISGRATPTTEAAVRASLSQSSSWWSAFDSTTATSPSQLYYCVVYLAPGDYHRFHSPVSWVCTSRRHFAGELYSVSPYVQNMLPGLFTLNERVVLLGKWKYGFFSYTAVGATNVGSVRINFDKELKTNSLVTDTEADRQAAAAAERGEQYMGYSEATYDKASPVLGGHPLRRGEEIGGFALGSSIVMVFEAPSGSETPDGKEVKDGWKWAVDRNQKVKVGQALGYIADE